MKTNFVNEQISKMQAEVMNIHQLVKNGCSSDDYKVARMRLNMYIVQALIGGELGEDSDKNGVRKVKFNHKLPTLDQISNICSILDGFIENVERPILGKKKKKKKDEEDDIEIPAIPAIQMGGIQKLQKKNNNSLRAAAFGNTGSSYCQLLLTPSDCLEIASIAEEVRKAENIKKAVIIGGIVLVVAGATAVGVHAYKKHKHEQELLEMDDCEIIDSDIDDSVTDTDFDDVPEVEFDEV